jgi:tetratricopeptide (TPR) repeat protein
MPQHAKRLKIRRKDLQQPDEFETLTAQTLDWARRHQALVSAVAGGLVAVALVVLVVGRVRASHAEAAALDFRAAHGLFEAGKFGEAADAFATLAETSPRTPFGRLAGLYRAHAFARKGDPGSAATAYGEYLASSPPADYLRQEALVSMGRAKEGTSDASGALEAYTQAGALDGPFHTDALLAAARLDEAAGRTEDARHIYTQLLAAAPDGDTKAFLLSKVPGAAAPEAGNPEPESDVR